MYLQRIEDLPQADERAVIINCSTKEVTTLALLSTLRHAGMPVLLIDCESIDGSREFFVEIMRRVDFDMLSAPMRGHGITLDWVFHTITANKTLLVDSDAEILDPAILHFMRRYIDEPAAFGAGFINGPTWIDDLPGDPLEGAYLQERPWMPLTMLKVRYVREALAAGVSFSARTVYNEFFFSERLSHQLFRLRKRCPILKGLEAPKWLRRNYYGHTPAVVYCDTGAEVLQYLKYQRELAFVALPDKFHRRYVTHFGGLTRLTLDPRNIATPKEILIRREVTRRLRGEYGFDVGE